jgi:hypothetical protein
VSPARSPSASASASASRQTRRTRTAAQKQALLEKYDAASAKARATLLAREGLTTRQISRWRSERPTGTTITNTTRRDPAAGRAEPDDVVSVHVEALIFHVEALQRLLRQPASAISRTIPAGVIERVLQTTREAGAAARALLEHGRQPVGSTPRRASDAGGRRPWWGAAEPSATSTTRRKQWGQTPR